MWWSSKEVFPILFPPLPSPHHFPFPPLPYLEAHKSWSYPFLNCHPCRSMQFTHPLRAIPPGPKQQKRFKQLMLHRIKWHEDLLGLSIVGGGKKSSLAASGSFGRLLSPAEPISNIAYIFNTDSFNSSLILVNESGERNACTLVWQVRFSNFLHIHLW